MIETLYERDTYFTAIFSAGRRQALLTAVKFDGVRWQIPHGEGDESFCDPRLSFDLQRGEELRGDEPAGPKSMGWSDRGHLVRRLDWVWGEGEVASAANEDTCPWTNRASPYRAFSEGGEPWKNLENRVLSNADEKNVRVSVFTGPIFQDDDEVPHGVQIPRFFWKAGAVRDRAGTLYSSSYVESQAKYATEIPYEKAPTGDLTSSRIRSPNWRTKPDAPSPRWRGQRVPWVRTARSGRRVDLATSSIPAAGDRINRRGRPILGSRLGWGT